MNPNSRFNIYLPIIFALLLVAGIFIGMRLQQGGNSTTILSFPSKLKSDATKINDILDYVEDQYVDTINRKMVVENTIHDMLQNLDPHSDYISADELKETNEPLQGNFEGVGIEFNIIKDTIRVIAAISGGPSETAGITAGDKIVKIEGKNVAGIKIKNQDVMGKLRGQGGTNVTISIARGKSKKLMDFTITRGKIPIHSVDAAYMLTPKIGYIKISRFAATTYDEYKEAGEKLRSQGMKKLVLDLRDNPGGLLEAAVDISDEFLSAGKEIVYTKGKAHSKKMYTATNKGDFEDNELAVLIDEGSASASEILAGAIQDNDRGIIIGRKSFGKGLVQEQSEFRDGSAIRLTIARYYTPTGRCIQKPYNKGLDAYFNEESDRFAHGELENADSIKFTDSLKFSTPKGKIVYGGGGIMPDVFIPLDTTGRTRYFSEVIYKGTVNQFGFEYADKNREKLKRLGSAEKFVNNFTVDKNIFSDFISFAEKNGIAKNEKQISRSENLIKNQLKAIIARHIWGNEAFYPVVHKDDVTLKKAIENLK